MDVAILMVKEYFYLETNGWKLIVAPLFSDWIHLKPQLQLNPIDTNAFDAQAGYLMRKPEYISHKPFCEILSPAGPSRQFLGRHHVGDQSQRSGSNNRLCLVLCFGSFTHPLQHVLYAYLDFLYGKHFT